MNEIYDKFVFREDGLYFENEFLLHANISVSEKRTVYNSDMKFGNVEYRIYAEYTDGRPSTSKWFYDLKKIELWDFEINDSLLAKEKKNLIQFKLRHEAERVKNQIIVNVYSGLYSIQGTQVYVVGDQVFTTSTSALSDIVYKTHFKISTIEYTKQKEYEMCQRYINLIPGVSEMLFYGALYAIVKPFVECLDINAGFVIGLVGPPGHLKTTLVRNYALWLTIKEMQEIGFYFSKKNQLLLDEIDILSGQNYLLDDLRRVESRVENIRQQQRLDIISRHVNMMKGCANVFVTGESLSDMGIFSCIDRVLQIRIPRMNDVEILKLKNNLSGLDMNFMSSLALQFAKILMSNFETVIDDIEKYYNENSIVDEARNGCAIRTHRYAMFLRLTEFLFKKYYVTNRNGSLNEDDVLGIAIETQCNIQQIELQNLCNNESAPDYIADIFLAINKGEKIKTLNNPNNYVNYEKSCLVNNGRIYITSAALKNLLFILYGRFVDLKLVIKRLHEEGILEEEANSRGYQKNYCKKKHYVISVDFLVAYMVRNGYVVSEDMKKKYYPNYKKC